MVRNARLQLALWACGGAGLLLAACSAAPTPIPTATLPATVAATAALPASPTLLPATAAVAPTQTAAPSATASSTAAASSTATVAPTNTIAPSATATATVTASATATAAAAPTSLPTRVRVTITPLGPPESASLFSITGGPAGYSSHIICQRAGAACTPVMAPGDLSFNLSLAGEAGAPWTHFISYGLSVEKDGANVAGMFMFVDAGWLQPGTVVGFGASRGFSAPGVYVIRSSGCLTTDAKSSGCSWATIAGDVVTFRIE